MSRYVYSSQHQCFFVLICFLSFIHLKVCSYIFIEYITIWIVCFSWTCNNWMLWIWELSIEITSLCICQVVLKHGLLIIPRSPSLKIKLLVFFFLLKQNWFIPKFAFVMVMLGGKIVSLIAAVHLSPSEQLICFYQYCLIFKYITFVTAWSLLWKYMKEL